MNRFLKYILFFLVIFIIYLLINNKLIEGYENELRLLFNISKDRTDIGCNNYQCVDDYEVNPNTRWQKKFEYKDENSLLCNNSRETSPASLLNSGNKCNNELCCDDMSCEKRYFSEGYSCHGRDRYPRSVCIDPDAENCFTSCCNQNDTPGASKTIYDNIKAFRDKVYQNTIQEFGTETTGRCGDQNEYSIIYPEINDETITGLDVRNFIYFSLLDLDHMRNNNDELSSISTTINLINYNDFECIHEYISSLYTDIIGQSDDTQTTIKTSLSNNNIFTNNTRLKIKEELLGDDTVSDYADQLTNSGNTLYNQRLNDPLVTKLQIHDNFLNFVRFYTNDDTSEQIQHNTHEDLIKNFKLVTLMIANPFINGPDHKTPLDILLQVTDQYSYKTKQIDATQLKYIM